MNAQVVLLPVSDANPGAGSSGWELVSTASDGALIHVRTTRLDPAPAGSVVTVVVPAVTLSWHRVKLPPGLRRMRDARMRAVLEGLLEECVLDEPAALHLALQTERSAQGEVWVAVCSRAGLQEALKMVEQAGYGVRSIVPEWGPKTGGATPATMVWLTGTPEQAEWVWSDQQGVHRYPYAEALYAALAPPEAELWAEPAVAALAQRGGQREVQIEERARRLLRCAESDWSLAQMEFARGHPRWQRWVRRGRELMQAPVWRPARWALVAMALIQLLGLNLAAWQAQRDLRATRLAIQQVLLSTFPQTSVVVDAPVQMERAVAVLRQVSGEVAAQDLESMLAALGRAPAYGEVVQAAAMPITLEFAPGELNLELGRTLPPPLMEALQSQLRDADYAVQVRERGLRLRPGGTL